MALTPSPEMAAALAPFADPDFTPPPVGDVAGRRRTGEALLAATDAAQPTPADVTRTDYAVTGEDGNAVPLRWYAKDASSPGSAVVYFHGGGYIQGHVDLFDGTLSRYASDGGVPLLAVEYRRAPEHPHPAPVHDAYAALGWLHEHAAELGVDPERIGVMGDSAGAGLAASLAILARDRGGPAIARQILVMPMLDDRTLTPDPQIADSVIWSTDDNRTAWTALLGHEPGGPDTPPTAAPARLEDASGLPPAYVEVGQIDLFRDEDLAYAATLGRAGVEVEFHLHPGVVHEFDSIAYDADVSRRAHADRVRVLQSL